MKNLLFILAAVPCLASGPKYNFDDPRMNDELANVYKDLANTLKGKSPVNGNGYYQTVQAVTTTKTTTSSVSYVDVSNHTVTITPTSAKNRIKLTFVFTVESANTSSAIFTLLRGSTDLGGSNGFAHIFAGSTDGFTVVTLNYIDSPATTSATTYKLQVKSLGSTAISVGEAATNSVMIAEEIS